MALGSSLLIERLHCQEISIYVFPEKELRGLSPNFHIHVSVSDLFYPTISPVIFQQQHMQPDRGKYIAQRNMKVGIGTVACGHAFLFVGIYVLNFRYGIFAVCF